MSLSRGEKIFFGTIVSITAAGSVAGYATAHDANNAPISVVVEAEDVVHDAQLELDSMISQLPLCGRAVLATLEATGQTATDYSKDAPTIISNICDDGSEEPANLAAITSIQETKTAAQEMLLDAKDKNEFSPVEIAFGFAFGGLLGLFGGLVIAIPGEAAVDKFKNRDPQ